MKNLTEEILLTLKLLGELRLNDLVISYKELDGSEVEATVRQMMYYLRNKDLVQKRRTDVGVCFYLTEPGLEFINSMEKVSFPEYDNWDFKWTIILFDIPEKERHLRDRFRRQLKKSGFGMLQRGVWIIPVMDPQELNDLLSKFSVEKYCIIVSGEFENFQISPEILKEKFNLTSLFCELKNINRTIMSDFTRIRRSKIRGSVRLTALMLIRNRFRIRLADIIRKFPPFPRKILPDPDIFKRALSDYKTVRKFCTSELFKARG